MSNQSSTSNTLATTTTTVSHVAVPLQTSTDMMVMRFAQQLMDASRNEMMFSFTRYGYLTGVLPPVRINDNGMITPQQVVPTTSDNIDARIVTSITRGGYAVERAWMAYRGSEYTVLQTITMIQILKHADLVTLFVELCASIYEEIRLNAATKFTSGYAIVDTEVKRVANIQNMAMAVQLHHKHSGGLDQHSYSAGVLESVNRVVDSTTDKLSSQREEQLFSQLKIRSLGPLHHLLRLCMDACRISESELMNNREEQMYDIPLDCPVDGLSRHIKSGMSQSLIACANLLENIDKAAKRRLLSESVWKWLLSARERRILFANLVEVHFHMGKGVTGSTSIRIALMNRMGIAYNCLVTYFATHIDRDVNAKKWLNVTD